MASLSRLRRVVRQEIASWASDVSHHPEFASAGGWQPSQDDVSRPGIASLTERHGLALRRALDSCLPPRSTLAAHRARRHSRGDRVHISPAAVRRGARVRQPDGGRAARPCARVPRAARRGERRASLGVGVDGARRRAARGALPRRETSSARVFDGYSRVVERRDPNATRPLCRRSTTSRSSARRSAARPRTAARPRRAPSRSRSSRPRPMARNRMRMASGCSRASRTGRSTSRFTRRTASATGATTPTRSRSRARSVAVAAPSSVVFQGGRVQCRVRVSSAVASGRRGTKRRVECKAASHGV